MRASSAREARRGASPPPDGCRTGRVLPPSVAAHEPAAAAEAARGRWPDTAALRERDRSARAHPPRWRAFGADPDIAASSARGERAEERSAVARDTVLPCLARVARVARVAGPRIARR